MPAEGKFWTFDCMTWTWLKCGIISWVFVCFYHNRSFNHRASTTKMWRASINTHTIMALPKLQHKMQTYSFYYCNCTQCDESANQCRSLSITSPMLVGNECTKYIFPIADIGKKVRNDISQSHCWKVKCKKCYLPIVPFNLEFLRNLKHHIPLLLSIK